jgi:acyl-CoA dehydrogenase
LLERALAATIASEPIEAKIRAAVKDGRVDGRLPPGAGIEMLVERARAAGILDAAQGDIVLASRDLTARVIRVDDFPQDLGWSELQPATASASAPHSSPTVIHRVAA